MSHDHPPQGLGTCPPDNPRALAWRKCLSAGLLIALIGFSTGIRLATELPYRRTHNPADVAPYCVRFRTVYLREALARRSECHRLVTLAEQGHSVAPQAFVDFKDSLRPSLDVLHAGVVPARFETAHRLLMISYRHNEDSLLDLQSALETQGEERARLLHDARTHCDQAYQDCLESKELFERLSRTKTD